MARSKYDARKENFIQKYATANKISTSESRKFYRENYEPASDNQRRKIMRDTTNKIKERYPNKHPANERDDRGFKFPKQKKQTKKESQKNLRKQLKSRQTKTFPRVQKAFKKYPHASKYELQHGVNSKASQEYRIRHGRDRNYK